MLKVIRAVDHAPSDMPWSAASYVAFLRLVRKFRQQRRRRFRGTAPEWFSDFSGFLGHVNLLGCLPTILGVLLVPQHFFRRVKDQPKRAIPLSVSPTKLIMQCCALAGLCLVPLGYRLDHKLLFLYTVLVAFSSPIWIAVLVCLTAFVAFLFRNFQNPAAGNYLLKLMVVIVGEALPLEKATLCLRKVHMNHLALRRFLWGSCYLSLAILVELTAVIAVIAGMTYASISNGSGSLLWITVTVCVTFGVISANLLVTAYSGLLNASALYPGKAYYRRLKKELTRLSEAYYLVFYTRAETRSNMLSLMNTVLADAVTAQDRNQYNPPLLYSYVRSREGGLSWIEDMTIYFEHPEDLETCRSFTALKQPALVTAWPRETIAIAPSKAASDKTGP